MKNIVTLLLITMISLSSCEKDDICDANTSTTPRLIIEFYDKTNPTVLKNVTNLKVIGEGMEEGIVFNSSTGDSKYLTSGTSISIPLKTDADTATFRFILNYGNPNPTLIDTDEVTFNYSRQDVFVSRACGYKTVYAFIPNSQYIQTAIPDTKAIWMQYISVEKSNIENENETHVKVFF